MAEFHDVTIITVHPGTHPQALTVLEKSLPRDGLRACWYSELGGLNQILIIRRAENSDTAIGARLQQINTTNPFGIGELIANMTMDTYVSLDIVGPMTAGEFGPFYEVRTYMLKPDGLPPTIQLWREAVPGRAKLSPLLAVMICATGPVTRFMHIWPYRSLDERGRIRAQAIAEGVWPPKGGAAHFVTQQTEIYLPAPFSPLR
ncbi:MAG TPA: NIPSNAP family protein [Hyphomicrobiales bacterium]|nr:NIPSNAP family protein [Hyphomicrobiales bacterium]